jgi:hypothetical protein
MRVVVRDQDGRHLGDVRLDEHGVAVLQEGGRLNSQAFFSRKLLVPRKWASEHGLEPPRRGPVEVLPTDSEVYLQALAFLGISSYTSVRLESTTL